MLHGHLERLYFGSAAVFRFYMLSVKSERARKQTNAYSVQNCGFLDNFFSIRYTILRNG